MFNLKPTKLRNLHERAQSIELETVVYPAEYEFRYATEIKNHNRNAIYRQTGTEV
ncbi:hypothetical protein QTP88_015754 [Uroleucon formosanum]